MLGYLWKRFTASESAANNNAQIITNDYEATIAERDAQIESLKRSLTHKTDLAESYKCATERRDERIKELEQQVDLLDGRLKDATDYNESWYDLAGRRLKVITSLDNQIAELTDKLAAIDAILNPTLSPKGDKTEVVESPIGDKPDDDTAEFTAPRMFDSGPYGE